MGNVKDNWQGYGIAVLTSLILGSGGATLLSSSRIDALRAEVKEDVLAVEVREQKNFELLIEIAKDQIRIQEQLKYMQEALDAL